MVLVTCIVFALLSAKAGIINAVIKQFGGKDINWYIMVDYWPVILTIVHV